VIFSVPGIILATIFVTLPFVAREVAPVLREVGDEQEQAAATLGASRWQTFLRVTLPAIRWGVAYGVILSTARAIGEFGAALMLAGATRLRTETLPVSLYLNMSTGDLPLALAAASILILISLVSLFVFEALGGSPMMLSRTKGGRA
jgi:ABC-type sulfate transport system permease subunit